jgi:hypothetical protein
MIVSFNGPLDAGMSELAVDGCLGGSLLNIEHSNAFSAHLGLNILAFSGRAFGHAR